MANAAVIRPRSAVGLPGARARASCMPIIVTTMKVLPTSRAEIAIVTGVSHRLGSTTPVAMRA